MAKKSHQELARRLLNKGPAQVFDFLTGSNRPTEKDTLRKWTALDNLVGPRSRWEYDLKTASKYDIERRNRARSKSVWAPSKLPNGAKFVSQDAKGANYSDGSFISNTKMLKQN